MLQLVELGFLLTHVLDEGVQRTLHTVDLEVEILQLESLLRQLVIHRSTACLSLTEGISGVLRRGGRGGGRTVAHSAGQRE